MYITKSSGEKELFDEEKFRRSLEHAGADEELIEHICREVQKILFDGISTREIYRRAFELLGQEKPFLAARYNLKQAIFGLGPTGFPFERYVAELLKTEGYETKVGEILRGHCVAHEVDVIAEKGEEHVFIEAKYHKEQGLKTDVKVALYVQARFEDIERHFMEKEKQDRRGAHQDHQAWLVTNTKLTSEAIAYGECVSMRLIAWGYPKGQGLQNMIEKAGLHPVTALTTISEQKKQMLLEKGIVLCRDIARSRAIVESIGLSKENINRVIEEAKQTCAY